MREPRAAERRVSADTDLVGEADVDLGEDLSLDDDLSQVNVVLGNLAQARAHLTQGDRAVRTLHT
jgi:hypothetical protein